MFSRRLLLAIAAVSVTLGFSPAAFADALGDISSRGTIRVAVPQDFRPSVASARIWRRRVMISTLPI